MDEQKDDPPAEVAQRIPLGVYTPKAGVGPADVPTNAFRPRPKPNKPQDASEE
ncbi:hypothetical protein [Candidatus Poriferisodalis sp.]|uniref:hypothetical protein n=1 Tax=Candidatus Poriferisodalis sp. TaxID=3101277 RepID=UPI003B02B9FB